MTAQTTTATSIRNTLATVPGASLKLQLEGEEGHGHYLHAYVRMPGRGGIVRGPMIPLPDGQTIEETAERAGARVLGMESWAAGRPIYAAELIS